MSILGPETNDSLNNLTTEGQGMVDNSPAISSPEEKDWRSGVVKELMFGSYNLTLFMAEVLRDASHYDLGEYGQLGQGIPIAVEGIRGFIDQHVGDVVETLGLFYLSRVPIELFAKAVEIWANKKIDPRIKIGTALFISVSVISGLELTGHGGGF